MERMCMQCKHIITNNYCRWLCPVQRTEITSRYYLSVKTIKMHHIQMQLYSLYLIRYLYVHRYVMLIYRYIGIFFISSSFQMQFTIHFQVYLILIRVINLIAFHHHYFFLSFVTLDSSQQLQPPRFTTQPSSSGSIVSEGRTKILQCHALGKCTTHQY